MSSWTTPAPPPSCTCDVALAARPTCRDAGNLLFVTTAATVSSPTATTALCAVRPQVPVDRLVTDLVPPRHFANARFATYRANPAHPSQGRALARLQEIAAEITAPRRGLFARRRTAPAVYLDGGFGVGKTHLLASLVARGRRPPKAYGTFVELHHLVGALGFHRHRRARWRPQAGLHRRVRARRPRRHRPRVHAPRPARRRRACALAATSNTLPDALGEGRFAAARLPARDPGPVRPLRRPCGSTARTTATAGCPPPEPLTDGRSSLAAADRPGAHARRRSTACSTHLARAAPQPLRRAARRGLRRRADRRAPRDRPGGARCASWCSSTGSTTATCRCCLGGVAARRAVHRGDARGRLPQEVLPRPLPPGCAGRGGPQPPLRLRGLDSLDRRRRLLQLAARRAFSVSMSKSAGGQPRSSDRRAPVSSSVTARRAYHFRSAGTTYQGATSVEVRSSISW